MEKLSHTFFKGTFWSILCQGTPLGLILILSSCSIQKQVSRSAQQVIKDSSLMNAHVGISIYEPASGKYWYNYNGNKYFVPASNTKIPTCYAAMKYLGDSLVGMIYDLDDEKGRIRIRPTGDPTFLHPDFKNQPVYEFLKKQNRPIVITNPDFLTDPLGSGWAWNDYNEYYMAERSAFPVYGNVVKWKIITDKNKIPAHNLYDIEGIPDFFRDSLSMEPPQYPVKELSKIEKTGFDFTIHRKRAGNIFELANSITDFTKTDVPFETSNLQTLTHILEDTLHLRIEVDEKDWVFFTPSFKSQPTDSLLKPMMHHSDNFFAEQTLLMISSRQLDVLSDELIIDTLLKTDFKDLPQKPRWVDGSGLSRYNLFSPQDFVTILEKMEKEFGMERIKTIFATGGEGTLGSYYRTEAGYIYAKTGTLSGVVSLSGYLYTKKNKLLLFSILVNNHQGSATAVRRAVEKFVREIRNKW